MRVRADAKVLSRQREFDERVELLVMSALHILGIRATLRRCRTFTRISTLEVWKFVMSFLDAFMDMEDEYIFLPHNIAALNRTMKPYKSVELPGACGSIDVVHIKWSACPTGDHNHAKGKEGYPTIAFQCITEQSSLSWDFWSAVWESERSGDRQAGSKCLEDLV